MATVLMKQVGKIYRGGVEAVKNLSIEIQDGEFMCLLGPSGCGKSTTMRMIAGLEEITSGEMFIEDIKVNDLPPKERDIAMAFENYALYPHMTIGQNIAFPLEIRKFSRELIRQKVKEVASLLGIEHMLNEQIKGLSGGVQQRVGVARALVRNPKVLILDEPISHLEEELKAKMREELRKLQRKISVTTLYVTHDQIEAMVMADRIAIMNFGVLQQVDTPENVYLHPANTFVGGFIGEPPMNFITCELIREEGIPSLLFGDIRLPCPENLFFQMESKQLKKIILGVRDTQIRFQNKKTEGYIEGRVFFIEPRNEEQIATIEVGGHRILATTSIETELAIDKPVWITFDFERCNFFDERTSRNIFSGGEYGYR